MDRKERVRPETVEFSFRVPAEVAANLKAHALSARATAGELVADLVMEHLREWELIDSRERHEAA